ncbi:MAG: hypothetical protein U0556_14740 [Dehalococcoidia bacterium]
MDLLSAARLGEAIERDAVEDAIAATPAEVARQLGLRVRRFGETAVVSASNAPTVWVNRTIGLGLDGLPTDTTLDSIIDELRAHAPAAFALQISPLADRPEIGGWFAAKGLHYTGAWTRLVRGAEPPQPVKTEVRVEQAETADAEHWATILGVGFGLPVEMCVPFSATIGRPGWLHYLGYLGDQPVACAAMFVRDGSANLGYTATLPEARGRGAQSALIARRIGDAIALGCRFLTAEVEESTEQHPNPSHFNLVRAGFTIAYNRHNWEGTAAD